MSERTEFSLFYILYSFEIILSVPEFVEEIMDISWVFIFVCMCFQQSFI